MVFKDPDWDYRTLDFDRGTALADKIENGAINAMDPNLKRFFGRGGKLIHYHGWSDPQIMPMSSVTYFKNVLETMGGAGKVKDSYRLFMVPGMAHCGGGDGTSTFDMVGALEQWAEKGESARPDPCVACSKRRHRSHAAAVPVPASGESIPASAARTMRRTSCVLRRKA